MAIQVDDEISKAAFSLLLSEPFYAHVLAGMPRLISEEIKTMGVAWSGQQINLVINPKYFNEDMGAKQRVAMIKHEVLHVTFRHLFRKTGCNRKIYDIASDLVVNQLVEPWPLPEDAFTLDDFPDLNLKPDQTLDYYYNHLSKLNELTGPGEGNGVETSKSADSLTEGMSDHSQPSHSHKDWHDGDGVGATAGLYSVGNLLLRAKERTPPHQWGTLPAALLTELDLILADRQPKLDWRRTVRLFCGSSGRTKIRHTIKRVSKRYGTRPGVKVQRMQRLLVAVDTSASVDEEMLLEFFTEIHGAWRAGATVTVVECDAEVQRHYEYCGKPPKGVQGGGGTEFEPVFLWMQQQRPYDGLLYLTDGYGPIPSTRPSCKVLWVLPESTDELEPPETLPFGPILHLSKV